VRRRSFVIEDVLKNVKRDLDADQVDTSPLDELRRLWRSKM
jgi:hypothetical protein